MSLISFLKSSNYLHHWFENFGYMQNHIQRYRTSNFLISSGWNSCMYVCMYVYIWYIYIYIHIYIYVEFKFLAWSSIAQSVFQRAFGLLAIWCLGPRVQILPSAEEHNLSPFDLNIACLCQSIEIYNNKYIYIQAIIWNYGLIYWRLYASFGLYEPVRKFENWCEKYHEYLKSRQKSSWRLTIRMSYPIQGVYSLSERMSYRKISLSLEAAGFGFKFFLSFCNLTGTSPAPLPRCLSNFKAVPSLWHLISRLRYFTRFDSKA